MDTNMILSASGWRKVFAESNNEQDKTKEIGSVNAAISIFAAYCFSGYIKKTAKKDFPTIILGTDTRPTGEKIANFCIKTFVSQNIDLRFIGVTAAPEIMAYSKQADGFMYISASHNPIGHNGIKFGLNSGGVLNAEQNAQLTEDFKKLCQQADAEEKANDIIAKADSKKIEEIYKKMPELKKQALNAYKDFLKETTTAEHEIPKQEKLLQEIKNAAAKKNIGIACDMNGSARSVSVDKEFFSELGIDFYAINDKPGEIVHEIIPESENLVYVAAEMEKLHADGIKNVLLGYMPDCDGDRGNIVYWSEAQQKSVILKAQEVFSLSVVAELSFSKWKNRHSKDFNPAVVVNCPTSMRIDEIAEMFGAKVFRAEVGEANVVNLATEARNKGYDVRIFGEGSNGGTITYPCAVRDPINTVFAIIKLLSIKEIYNLWCSVSGTAPKENYSLDDILNSIPKYTTTGVSEPRAILHVKTRDHSVLKKNFQKVFESQWEQKYQELYSKYGIKEWECVITNGTKQIGNITDFSSSGKGGLKIKFYDENDMPIAFIWMRGSGTEPVFRIMCDVKGVRPQMEKELLQWETKMIEIADKM